MKKSLVTACIALTLAFAVAAQEKVTIAAAANLASVGDRLAAAFSAKYPQYQAQFTFASSGALVTQIQNGAPFQVFMSADVGFAKTLADAGLCTGAPATYAIGKLILFTIKDLDLKKGLAILGDASVQKWANANPETAPYGRAAQQALTKAGLYDEVKDKLVTAQSVAQALQFALTGADAAFVNKSAIYTKELKPYAAEGKYWIEVDQQLYEPIKQAFVVLNSAALSKGAAAFSDFLLSPEGRAVFASYGYDGP